MEFEKFNYNNLEEVIKDAKSMDLNLQFSNRMELFHKNVVVNNIIVPNSLAFHPMEGTDGNKDGSPSDLTKRRYERFSKGGAGLIWFEAVSVVPEGRVCPEQLWINNKNLEEFKKLRDNIILNSQNEFGSNFKPVLIMQLTHSGRFSKPKGIQEPIIAYHNPYLVRTWSCLQRFLHIYLFLYILPIVQNLGICDSF